MTRNFPFPAFPVGWFQVAWSEEVEAGASIPVRAFGSDLVLYRTQSGQARLLDAFCPHLGAHLGHGGKVEGDDIRCPFHAWKFNGEGTCTEIPYADKIPSRAKIRPWHISEKNKMIMAWYHPEGIEPQWELPEVPEYEDDGWTEPTTREWMIKTRNQEMSENSVDGPHFRFVHGVENVPQSVATANGNILEVKNPTSAEVPGAIDADLHGLGFSLTRFKEIIGPGSEALLVASNTPIEEELVRARFSFIVRKADDPRAIKMQTRAFIREIERQMSQDIPIWENKTYIDPPLLCTGDGPVGKLRSWSKQFYAETT